MVCLRKLIPIQPALSVIAYLFCPSTCDAEVARLDLPSETRLIVSAKNISENNRAFHVGSGGSLQLTGNACIVYVEAGGKIAVMGDSNQVYVIKGATGSVQGDENAIHLIGGASLTIKGRGNKPALHPSLELVRAGLPVDSGNSATAEPPAPPPSTIVASPSPVALRGDTAPMLSLPKPPSIDSPAPPSGVGSPPPEKASIVVAPPVTVNMPIASAPAAPVFKDLPEDPAVAKTPGISTLIALLPMPQDKVQVQTRAASVLPTDLVGHWEIEELIPEGISLLGVSPEATGTIDFDAAGNGSMEINIDILGQEIVRRGPFAWRADEASLLINEGGVRASTWSRVAKSATQQTLKLKGVGTLSATLRLKAVKR
jgi:hypothetical protein